MTKSTKHYILKQGTRMSYILHGEPVNFVGDGKGTVELNEDQAKAFKDKFSGVSDKAVEFGSPVLVGGQTLEGSDISAAAEKGMASNGSTDAAKAVSEAKANEAKAEEAKPAASTAKK